MKKYFYSGIAIVTLFVIFTIFNIYSDKLKKEKEAGRNEIRIEKLQDENTQNKAVIKHQKKTNEVQAKQKKIISNLDIPDKYRVEWLRWIHQDATTDN